MTDPVRCGTDTVDRLVRLRAERDPTSVAVIDPHARITYGQLHVTTIDLAAAFIEAGVGKGTRVGLIMPNSVRWVQIAVALTRIGAVLVPLSTLLAPPELAAQLRTASVRVLISVPEFRGRRYLDDLEAHRAALPALRAVWTAEQAVTAPVSERATRIVDALTDAVTPSDLFVVMFTSGSSGPPKGSCTPTATHWRRCVPGWTLGASRRRPGCICRCRSSGWVGSAAVCSRRCWPARRW